ncbi:MAG: hypothetical protein Ct9H300mP31_09830 [Acidimicrobiaceae bacterium]|nr:MAG: hypothetical protein Ct9H300mP31_09830 [Acidimicrobiaceae bacterium]
MTAILGALPALLDDEPALPRSLAPGAAALAVAEPARAMVLAALVQRAGRLPLIVAVPTGLEAERLANDLRLYLGTAPSNPSPPGRPCPSNGSARASRPWAGVSGSCTGSATWTPPPAVVVASGRALVQRLGPGAGRTPPQRIGPGDMVDQSNLVADLIATGYRREYQVEHRGEMAVRGSIVDVWPSTTDAPFRIDLWGDEVDRLTEFGVADQRATVHRAEVEIYPCRELIPDQEVRERATALLAEQPWGREQWDRLADGELFDGMESWLPWLSGKERVLFDLVDNDALVVAVEPRRLRDRIADLRAEEAELATTLAATWGADGTAFPRLHTEWERLLVHTEAPVWTIAAVPDSPGVETVVASGWGRDALVDKGRRRTGPPTPPPGRRTPGGGGRRRTRLGRSAGPTPPRRRSGGRPDGR